MKSAIRPILLLASLGIILPGACPVASAADCNSNGIEDSIEIETGQSPDCNRNGRPDSCDLRVSFLEVTEGISRSLPHQGNSLAAADFDLDGDIDVVVSTVYGEILSYPGSGDGALWGPRTFSDVVTSYGWRRLLVADLDSDEAPDLVLRGEIDDLRIFRNTGGNQFAPPERFSLSRGYPSALEAGDVDGDGDVDLIALFNEYAIEVRTGILTFVTNQEGVLSESESGATSPGEWYDVKAEDLDLDGDLDIVLVGYTGLSVLLNRGDGSFLDPVLVGGVEAVDSMVVEDLSGDGYPDVAVAGHRSSTFVFLNRTDGSFDPPESYRHYRHWSSALLGDDLDGDGDVDLFTSSLSILHNKGGGTFYPRASAGTVSNLGSALSADLDGEGLPEVIGTTWGSPHLLLILSTEVAPRANLDCNRDGIPDDCQLENGVIEDCNGNNIPDTCEHDCNGNGIPDDCDLELGSSVDENLNGVPDECDSSEGFFPDCDSNGIIDTWEDCNQNGVPDGCELASGAVEDCSGNGVPDACEPDCNENGIPDDCEILDGSSADTNSNGVPDECEASARFLLSFQAPDRVPGVRGSKARFRARTLVSGFDLTPEEPGITGWSLSIRVDRATIVNATMDGTAASEVFSGGFHKTAIVDPSRLPPDSYGVVSATVLSFTEPISFDVRDTPVDVLDLLLEVDAPSDGGCGSCRLEYFDGLQSGGQPVHNAVTYGGYSCWLGGCDIDPDSRLDLEAKEILVCPLSSCSDEATRLCALPMFRRGDVNSDGTVDISDAISEFMYLFLGGGTPRCLDAADSNDDEAVDLSDGIHILDDFFRDGTGMPYPGPFYCGPDPTGEALGCVDYPPCGSSPSPFQP